jgi:hypothetical protein
MASKPELIELTPTEDDRPRPPIEIFPPSLYHATLVKTSVANFKKALEGFNVYPPDLVVDEELGLRIDVGIYTHFKEFFIKLAMLLGLTDEDLESMDSLSRHEFFVCTDPVQSWQDPEVMLPGLSKLEKLLGYSYPTSGVSEKPPYIPSNDYESYVAAAVCLNFKGVGVELIKHFDINFLSNMLKDAAYLSDPDKHKEGEVVEHYIPKAPSEIDTDFENKKSEIGDKLESFDIKLPGNF